MRSFYIIAISTVILVACTSPQTTELALAKWLSEPSIEDGFADTQCVKANNSSLSLLKNKAVALARGEITRQIESNVGAMDKVTQIETDIVEATSGGETYTGALRIITDQALSGSRATKVEYVELPSGLHLCVMVVLNPAQSKTLFKDIIETSTRHVSSQHEAVLWQEFKAHKLQQELAVDLEKARKK